MSAILTRLLASFLIAESLFGGLRVAGLLSTLGGHDVIAVVLILLRGLLGALQFIAGWLLATRRPQGFALAQGAFLAAAILTPFDVGLGLAPTSVYPWYRWHVTAAYGVFALAAARFLRRQEAFAEQQPR